MKVLLVSACKEGVRKAKGEVVNSGHLFGLLYIASYLLENIPGVVVKLTDERVSDALEEFKPDLVGISCISQHFEEARRISRLTKEKGIPVIIGGHHISLCPHTLDENMDIGVMGEGEITMFELAKLFAKSGKLPDYKDLLLVEGIVFHDTTGKLTFTQPRPLLPSLDGLPYPARSLLKPEYGKNISMISSRGCPYNCVFCFSSRFWGNKVRFLSAERLYKEIEIVLKKFQPKSISFWDDLFIASKERLRKVVELIEKNKVNTQVEFGLLCRANLIDEEVVDLLKRMNVVHVGLGLESGCDKTLKYLKGEGMSVAQNERAIELLRKNGILVRGSFIIGSPLETREDIMQTYNFVKKAKLYYFDTFLLTPLPGTPVWDYAKKRGLIQDGFRWENLDLKPDKGKELILSEVLSRKEILGLLTKFRRLQKLTSFVALSKRLKRIILISLTDPVKLYNILSGKIIQRRIS